MQRRKKSCLSRRRSVRKRTSESDREIKKEAGEEEQQKSDRDRPVLHWQAAALWRTIRWRLSGTESIEEAQYLIEELEYEFDLTGDKQSLTKPLLRDRILWFQMCESRRKIWDNLFEMKECRDKLNALKSTETRMLFSIDDRLTDLNSEELFECRRRGPSYEDRIGGHWKDFADLDRQKKELEKKRAKLESGRRRILKTYKEQTYAVMKLREETQKAYLVYSDSLIEAEQQQPTDSTPKCFYY